MRHGAAEGTRQARVVTYRMPAPGLVLALVELIEDSVPHRAGQVMHVDVLSASAVPLRASPSAISCTALA